MPLSFELFHLKNGDFEERCTSLGFRKMLPMKPFYTQFCDHEVNSNKMVRRAAEFMWKLVI